MKERDYIEAIEKLNNALDNEQTKSMINQTSQYKKDFGFGDESNTSSIIKYILNLDEELEKIYHFLAGHIITFKNGNEIITEPKDDRDKIFTEYGIKQLMNIVHMYLSKNTLLSYYETKEEINNKVYNFGIELIDLIYCNYENFFFYPKPEELYQKYLEYSEKNNISIDKEELYNKCMQWSKEELNMKIKHFPSIVLAVIDSVHSTYLRAYRGEERKNIWKRTMITQNNSEQLNQPIPQKRGWFS